RMARSMTMRKPVARIFLMASALSIFGVAATGTIASAQKPKPGQKPAPAASAKPVPSAVSVDDDEPKKPGDKPAKPVDNTPTPQPGQPTEAAAQAKRLYESEKWWDAAQALYRVYSGETGDDEGNKQIAQFNFAKTLYKLKFYQGAYKIFIDISERPNH